MTSRAVDTTPDDAVRIEFAGPQRHPARIVRAGTTDQVVAAVRSARDHGLGVAVRSGGHSYARHGLGDSSALMIDLRGLGTVEIDPDRRVGSAGGGALAGSYSNVAGADGLATGFGDTAGVGISGLTLGGGIGYLSRRDGLTLDNLLCAEVVLADGEVVHADASRHADLFWALRGGGGNFGVVTRLDFRLTPTRAVAGGFLAFEADPAVLAGAVEAVLNGPDELSGMVNAMAAPPMPMIPEQLRGRPIVAMIVCWSGPPELADEAIAPLRSLAPVVADTISIKPYPAMFEGGPPRAGDLAYPATRTGFVPAVDEAWAARAIDAVAQRPAPLSVINLRPMGGAIARVDPAATAFAHRDRAVMATVASQVDEAARLQPADAWAGRTADALGLGGAGYVNFMTGASPDDVAAAYPAATLERLRGVKSSYDPENVFRFNHNIPPRS